MPDIGPICKQALYEPIRVLAKKVRKGDIRNTVLRQTKTLRKSISLLEQGRDIKSEEIKEFSRKNPDKADKLRRQVTILNEGIGIIIKAVGKLEEYKDATV